ncbi:MAG: hypothetical protein LBU89_14960, partial [Fibromonadaceae bacterium]|nr:hypothetical protein [Fibromonadaceae bacterium]
FVNTLSLWLRLVFTSNIGNLLFLFVTLLDARSGKKNIKNAYLFLKQRFCKKSQRLFVGALRGVPALARKHCF